MILIVTIEPSAMRKGAFPRQLLAVTPLPKPKPKKSKSKSKSKPDAEQPATATADSEATQTEADTGPTTGEGRQVLQVLRARVAARYEKLTQTMTEMAKAMCVFAFPSGQALRIAPANSEVGGMCSIFLLFFSLFFRRRCLACNNNRNNDVTMLTVSFV